MSLHKEMVLQKFEDFKIYFGQTLDLIGDAIDSANVLVQKHGWNLEQKIHAKNVVRIKKATLELLIKHFDTFKEDLRIYQAEGVIEFERRLKNSIAKANQGLLDLDKY